MVIEYVFVFRLTNNQYQKKKTDRPATTAFLSYKSFTNFALCDLNKSQTWLDYSKQTRYLITTKQKIYFYVVIKPP